MSGGPTTSRFVAFGRPLIGAEEIEEVAATLRSGWLTTGPRVERFERQFASYTGAAHAIAVNSCTAALHLSLLSCGIGPGDEVVTSPLTFCATANSIIHTGAMPAFADIDPVSMNIDPAAVAEVIGPRTRALLPVHYAGRPADVVTLRDLAGTHGLRLIEDAAHCVEGWVAGRKIGTTGDLTCFSFYSTKNLTTGEGGMVTTESSERAAFVRAASLHGLSRDAWTRYSSAASGTYDLVMAGFKYNMMDIQAAIGLHQLARLETNLATRDAVWQTYDDAFVDLPLIRPAPVEADTVHARHLYTVLVDQNAAGISRDALRRELHARGIGTSIHFRALHLYPYYAQRFGLSRGMFPHAEYVSDRTLSLPLSSAMSDSEVTHVIEAVRDVLAKPHRVSCAA